MDDVVSVEALAPKPRSVQGSRRIARNGDVSGKRSAPAEKGGILRRMGSCSAIDCLADIAPFSAPGVARFAPNIKAIADRSDESNSLLLSLKGAARRLIENDLAADKLVELTLARAAESLHLRSEQLLQAWLESLLEDTFKRVGPDLQRLLVCDCSVKAEGGGLGAVHRH